MREETIRSLNELNAAFYASVHESFSESRANPWAGWSTALEAIREADPAFKPLVVADFASGNMRFEEFLGSRFVDETADLTASEIVFHTFDNCDELRRDLGFTIRHTSIDLVEALLSREELAFGSSSPSCNFAVSFGFMHHIPSSALRKAFLDQLVGCVEPGGFIVVSFWRFMNDERLAAKAHALRDTARIQIEGRGIDAGDLEDGDWFLGWKDSDTLRYCHHFTDDEIDGLVASVSSTARLVTSFDADGKTGSLNRYIVLQVRG